MPASGADSAPPCVEHLWRLDSVTFGEGSFTEYVCVRCDADLLVAPGEQHPQTL